jgi:ribosomal protein S18 acetylase RimI-like enzyme
MVALTKKDEPQIIALDKACYVNYDLPAITPGEVDELVRNGFMLGIMENGRLAADIPVFYKKPGEWFLWGIATFPEMQERGFATALLKEVMKRAKEKKVKIGVSIRPGNEKSLGLFRKHGFVEKGLVKDFCGPGIDRLIFESPE